MTWHQQTKPDTCAIAAQEFILDEVTGRDFSEEKLTQEAAKNGWYNPGGGTPLECMGNLLEAHGIPVQKQEGCNLEDISDKLARGEKVLVGVNSDEIWNQQDTPLSETTGMPGQPADHAVQVTGIDNSDPNNPTVILNDPGIPDGEGLRVPAEQFLNAWEGSNRYMVSTDRAGDYKQPSDFRSDRLESNQKMRMIHDKP
jgi:hypothetical protein